MSKIVNEMSNRHKDIEHIQQWLRASTKKAIDLFKNKQDVSYLIDVVLYQMPWFEAGNEYEVSLRQEEQRKLEQLRLIEAPSSPLLQQLQIGSSTSLFSVCSTSKQRVGQTNNSSSSVPQVIKPSPHFELFSELSRFIMTILSFSNGFAPSMIKFLVSNIVPMQIKELEGCKKSEIQISVEGLVFDNQKKLLTYIRDLLSQYHLESVSDQKELSKEDSAFMLGVLKFHPNAKEKLCRQRKLLLGQAQFDDKISRCLYIQNKDGQKIDISYVKSVQNLVDEEFQKINLRQQGSPNQKRMMGDIVDLLVKIIKIYPLYQNDLCRILTEFYPHRVQGELFHKIYLTNTLSLAIKYPLLQPKILLIVVQKLLEIDSEIKLDYTAEADVVNSSKTSQIMAEKLDWLMLIMFEFIDYLLHDKVGTETCFGVITAAPYQSPSECEEAENKLFKMFLSVFSEQILITHQSKYVQFLMFYICSLRLSFEKAFLNQLMTNITKKNPLLYKSTQINSIYYLGSYLARAKYVTHESIKKIFNFLLSHLRNYIEKFDERQKEDNYNDRLHRIHQNLYHLLQAIMYVMCFRFSSVASATGDSVNILQNFFDILRQACDNFNALVFIPTTIQNVFMDVCEEFNETEFQQIVSENQQQSNQAQVNRVQPLESYFPFDPYCLQYSDKYVCEIYQNWQEFSNKKDEVVAESENAVNKSTHRKQFKSTQSHSSGVQPTPIVAGNSVLELNSALNTSFIANGSKTSRQQYGFQIDQLNNINDSVYDQQNMLSDEEDEIENSQQILKMNDKSRKNHDVLVDILDESKSKSSRHKSNNSTSNNQMMLSQINGKRKNPTSTTDDTPIMDDFPSPMNSAAAIQIEQQAKKPQLQKRRFNSSDSSDDDDDDSQLSIGNVSSSQIKNRNESNANDYSFGSKKFKKSQLIY